jgi:hypothetical protein
MLALAGFATEYYSYSGSPVIQGRGGASKRVGGVDLWIMGTPPCKFRVIGYLTDSRPAGPIPMAVRDGQLAANVRSQGGDGLIMNSDVSTMLAPLPRPPPTPTQRVTSTLSVTLPTLTRTPMPTVAHSACQCIDEIAGTSSPSMCRS